MDRLVIEENGGIKELPTKVLKKPEAMKPLTNKDCLAIFGMLQEKPGYPAELAKELSMNEQKVYYYIKQLKNAGLIEVEKTEERKGATAKYFTAKFNSFSVIPNPEIAKRHLKLLKRGAGAESAAFGFLREFLKDGIFSGKIVVGSSDPHGPYKARARDGHLAAELAAFLGANCSGFELPLVFLDTMVNDLKQENSNLIILGGPVTNKLAMQVNEYLPIKFVSGQGSWSIKSGPSGKEYNEDYVGIIEKIPHPHFKGKWILLIAGKRNTGTIAAIRALVNKTSQTIKPNIHNSSVFAHVVEGLDVNGDGLIDEVEFRE